MAFETTALTGDGVRETGGHGHINDAVAVLKSGVPNRAEPWRAERTARPSQARPVDGVGDVGALIKPTKFVGDGRVKRCRQLLAEYRLIGVDDLAFHACRDEQPDRPGGKGTKEFCMTPQKDPEVVADRL